MSKKTDFAEASAALEELVSELRKGGPDRHRKDSRYLTFNGETRTLASWARKAGINRNSLRNRLRLGWTLDEALTKPVAERGRYRGAAERPCNKCGDVLPRSAFYAGYGQCKKCVFEQQVCYRSRNKERIRVTQREWSLLNSDRVRAAAKKYRDSNRDKVRAAIYKWRDNNRERYTSQRDGWLHENRERVLLQRAAAVERCSDSYVKRLWTERGVVAVSRELIVAMREYIIQRRAINRARKELERVQQNQHSR